MRLGDQGLGRVPVHGGQGDLEFRGDAVAGSVGEGAKVDPGGDGGIRQVGLLPSPDEAQCGVETGGVSGGEELFRVGPFAACRPSSTGLARATLSRPSLVTAVPSRPSPEASASAV